MLGKMLSHSAKRKIVALIAVTAILLFAYAAVGHWHTTQASAERCQICHIAHSLSISISGAAVLGSPVILNRAVLCSRTDPALDLQQRNVSPRAPPFLFERS